MTIALGDFVTLFVWAFRDWPFHIGTQRIMLDQ